MNRRRRIAGSLLALCLAAVAIGFALVPGHDAPRTSSFRLGAPGPAGPAAPAPSPSPLRALSAAPPEPARWFSPASFWNRPLARNAPIEPLTRAWVSRLQDKVARFKPWINTTQYSAPVYVVPADRRTASVYIDHYDAAHQADFQQVPLPPDPRAAAGTDRHLVVYQTGTDTMWEFWNFYHQADGYHAGAGARIADVQTSPGIVADVSAQPFPAPYGATATGLPLLGGLMTPAELRAGRIEHVLAVAIAHPLMRFTRSWPAQRSDGDSTDACDIPEGARFRLPPDLDLDALKLPPVARAIARAVQKYGFVVRDRADAVTFYAQDPQTMASNPYPALFGGLRPDLLLANFPWDKLQALKAETNIPLPAAARVSRRARRGRSRGTPRAGSSACPRGPA